MGKKIYLTKQFYYFSTRIHKKYSAKTELNPSLSDPSRKQLRLWNFMFSKSLSSEFDMNNQQSKSLLLPTSISS